MFSRWIRALAVVAAAWLAFTWAPRASRAQTFTPQAPPMDGYHPKPASTVWVLGSLDLLGGGSKHLGALFAAYGGEAHVWLTPNFGFSARVSAYGAGEPDGGGADGRIYAASLEARTNLIERTSHAIWLFGALGGGYMTSNGYEHRSTDPHFDERFGVLTARGGVVGEWGPFAYGGALEGFVTPGRGFAIAPVMFVGFAL